MKLILTLNDSARLQGKNHEARYQFIKSAQMSTNEIKTASLPNLNIQKTNRNVSNIDLSILQKSKTIQSENWDILHRVKQSLEGNTFNNFFASSLAKLPSYKTPQELAKALAEQFIMKEISLSQKQRSTKSASRTMQMHNDSLPQIKPGKVSRLDRLKEKIRSKSRDQQLERIQEQNKDDSLNEIGKEKPVTDKIVKNKLALKERGYLERGERITQREKGREQEERELQKQKQKEKSILREKVRQQQDKEPERSAAIDASPEKKQNRPIRYTLQSVRHPPSPIQEPNYQFTYYLGLGNNHELIKRVLDARPEWHQITNANRANFRWQQSYNGYKYFKLNWHKSHKEMVNHFEFHPEISNKKNLLLNISACCDSLKKDPFEIVPVTFIIDFTDPTVESNLFTFFDFFNKNAPETKQLNKQDFQNKFLEIKKKLRIAPTKERKTIDFAMRETFSGTDYLWLLKPTGLNRGRGIHVFQSIDNLVELLIDYQYGYTEKQIETLKDENGVAQQKTVQYIIKWASFVVQKYIERPLLIQNRKFDIRVWVLVSTDLACYFFREGYIRMASEEYSTNDPQNLYIHLTNNAIQKHSEKYGEQEAGNQLSFDQVQQYLKGKVNFREQIVEKMKEIAYFAMNSVATKINKLNRKFCLEIFGFDFFLDELCNLYLIEVNTNPCLEESSPLLHMLIPRMVDDAFQLTLDQIFPIERVAESKFPVSNYANNFNMWQLMGELKEVQSQEVVPVGQQYIIAQVPFGGQSQPGQSPIQ